MGSDGVVSVALDGGEWEASVADVGVADEKIRPRWVVWSQQDTRGLVAAGVRLATGWDVAAVHRLLFGGRRPGTCGLACTGKSPTRYPRARASLTCLARPKIRPRRRCSVQPRRLRPP